MKVTLKIFLNGWTMNKEIKTDIDAMEFLESIGTHTEDLSEVQYRVYDEDFNSYFYSEQDLINYALEQQEDRNNE